MMLLDWELFQNGTYRNKLFGNLYFERASLTSFVKNENAAIILLWYSYPRIEGICVPSILSQSRNLLDGNWINRAYCGQVVTLLTSRRKDSLTKEYSAHLYPLHQGFRSLWNMRSCALSTALKNCANSCGRSSNWCNSTCTWPKRKFPEATKSKKGGRVVHSHPSQSTWNE